MASIQGREKTPSPEAPFFTFPTTSKAEPSKECSVRVVVHVRPLIAEELIEGCRECLQVAAKRAQVTCFGKIYSFDGVYGACNGAPASDLFGDCIQPLVDSLYKGYNASVFAYGQVGSGKTYTMGSAFSPGETTRGVIPSVLDRIFERMHDKPNVKCTVRASFVEIYKEGIRDLLASDETRLRLNGTPALNIREVACGGVCIAGATEQEVQSKEEIGALLMLGAQVRATASTNMNLRSSRSHAIFTITLEQQKQASVVDDANEDCDEEAEESREEAIEDDFLTAKMHLVDLAGSENVGKADRTGERLQEGISINRGLLALSKVIASLVGSKPTVPYRDSKLTRLLQDSLGGNSRTVMIACVSPADIHIYETSNTLSYASRARNIKNKPVANRDPLAAHLAYLRQRLALARIELSAYKKSAGNSENLHLPNADFFLQEELEKSEKQRKLLKDDNSRLRIQLELVSTEARENRAQQLSALCKYDSLRLQANEIRKTLTQPESEGTNLPELVDNLAVCVNEDITIAYLGKISELERENRSLREFKKIVSKECLQGTSISEKRKAAVAGVSDIPTLFDCFLFGQFPELADVDNELDTKQKEAVAEASYRGKQCRLDEEVRLLDNNVKSTQIQINVVMANSKDLEPLEQEYEVQVQTSDNEKQKLEEECKELNKKLQDLRTRSKEEQQTLQRGYQKQLKEKEEELKSLKRQEKELEKLRELLKEADETCEKLSKEIERKKAEKAQLTQQIEDNEKKYNEKMHTKDKQLRWMEEQNQKQRKALERQERIRNQQENAHRHKVMAGEEARSRLKEIHRTIQILPEMRNRDNSSETSTSTDVDPFIQDDKSQLEWLERELDFCNQRIILRTILDSETEQRRHAARLLCETEKRLAYVVMCITKDQSCYDRYSELVETLEKRQEKFKQNVDEHSAQIEVFQKMCAKATKLEEKLNPASEIKRWTDNARTLVEARALLRVLFKIASDLKARSDQYYVEKETLEQELAIAEEKLETSQYQIEDLTERLERAHSVLLLSASCSPENRRMDRNVALVQNLIDRMRLASKAHNEGDIKSGAFESSNAPPVNASNITL